ncbi:hypothetical protein MBGDN05_00213 [Thermoplasmatales archaeon SCGC AB-539-N05]|nr:hypothetical protein MBGDN05_00213 [Thermoplasmatales archaeon SCGC AB-539-N05]
MKWKIILAILITTLIMSSVFADAASIKTDTNKTVNNYAGSQACVKTTAVEETNKDDDEFKISITGGLGIHFRVRPKKNAQYREASWSLEIDFRKTDNDYSDSRSGYPVGPNTPWIHHGFLMNGKFGTVTATVSVAGARQSRTKTGFFIPPGFFILLG